MFSVTLVKFWTKSIKSVKFSGVTNGKIWLFFCELALSISLDICLFIIVFHWVINIKNVMLIFLLAREKHQKRNMIKNFDIFHT